MAVHPIDTGLYAHKFGTPEARAIWDEAALVERWLEVEAALAAAQGERGMIPAAAADAIVAHASLDHVDLDDVAERFRATNLDTVAVIRALAGAVPDGHGEYVHWGATTTDVTETGLSLQLRDALDLLEARLEALEAALLDLAEAHADTPMVARTHSQHALPMTFGLKAAGWARETRRLTEAVRRVREDACVGKVTGAAGTYAAFGPDGPALEAAVCDRLGLAASDITIQVSKARVKDVLHVLAGIASTYGRVANEVWNRQRTEIDELREPFVRGEHAGSSTLAFKRNPFECEWIRGIAALVKGKANTIRELEMEDERDGTRFAYYRALVPSAAVMTDGLVDATTRVIEGLEVDADAMRENLGLTRGFVAAEHVMMALAERGAGKQTAHEVIADAAGLAWDEDLTLVEALRRDGRALEYLDDDELDGLADPETYLGESVRLVEATLRELRDGAA